MNRRAFITPPPSEPVASERRACLGADRSAVVRARHSWTPFSTPECGPTRQRAIFCYAMIRFDPTGFSGRDRKSSRAKPGRFRTRFAAAHL